MFSMKNTEESRSIICHIDFVHVIDMYYNLDNIANASHYYREEDVCNVNES